MERVPFSQILMNASVDIMGEYKRLYFLFYENRTSGRKGLTVYGICSLNFMNNPFRGTCISLEDFNTQYNQNYVEYPSDFSIDYLVSFCEYSYNLALHNLGFGPSHLDEEGQLIQIFIEQVRKVIEKIGYMENSNGCVIDFVPKDQAAISVSEIVDDGLSYKVIEYNHHSMKGQLSKKKEILLSLGNKLEPQQKILRQINSTLESDLYFLLNNINLRHNNSDPSGKNYNCAVASMSEDEIEQWYDITYQVCLLAFLELDHLDRKGQITELKKQIQR